MKKVKSLAFSTIDTKEMEHFSNIKLIYKEIKEFGFNEEKGLGFINVQIEDEILTASVIKRVETFIQDYDRINKVFQKRQISVFSETHFSLDFKNKLIYVFGGVHQINNLKIVLKNLFAFPILISPINLSPANFYKLIIKKKIIAEIDQLVIGKFNYNNGIIGRFTGNVKTQGVGSELIEQYNKDILKISLKIKISDKESLHIQISPNGNVKFISEENDVDFFINYIKTLIFY